MSKPNKKKHRNTELAVIKKNDPARLRPRLVETKKRKLKHNRAHSKKNWKKEESI